MEIWNHHDDGQMLWKGVQYSDSPRRDYSFCLEWLENVERKRNSSLESWHLSMEDILLFIYLRPVYSSGCLLE